MAGHSLLILPGVARQGGSQLFHLGCCYLMPSTYSTYYLLHGQWNKGDALLATKLPCFFHLSFIGKRVARSCDCSSPCGILERMYDSYIQGSVSPSSPAPDENVCRPSPTSPTSGCLQFHQDWLPHCKFSSVSYLQLLLVLPAPIVPTSGYLQFHQNCFFRCRSFKSLPPEAYHRQDWMRFS